MKRFFFRSLLIVVLTLGFSLPALADTILLKDGSVLHGQVVGFKDQQFTILLGSGARGRKSRITVYMEDVESIEFDSTGGTGAGSIEDTGPSNTQPSYQPPSNTQPSYQPPPTAGSPVSGPNTSSFQVNVRVRGDGPNAVMLQFPQDLDQAAGLDDWHLENCAHGAADRSPQKWAAASFADQQSMHIKCRAIANQRAEILSVGKPIDCRE